MTEPLTLLPEHDPAPGWGQSLADGAPGIALLHVTRARAGIAEWTTAHQWVAAMTRSPVVADPHACGLFRGAPAVAYVLRTAAHPAYASALASLDAHITALTRHRLAAAHERIDRRQPPALREFDLISGLTGIAVYLLQAHHHDLVREVLSYLVRLATEPVLIDGQPRPGWWTSHGPSDQPSPGWPGGHGNLGLAHGISGPLAVLATATRLGVNAPGQAEAIETICSELDRWRRGDDPRWWWPGMLSSADWTAGNIGQPRPHRASWCYGTPGIARAQQIAGLALRDQRRQHEAETALAGCLTDDRQLAALGEAGICHGWAGLVHTTERVAAEAGPDSTLAAHLPGLHTRFDHQLRQHQANGDGLLEGAAGIKLTRHPTDATRWDSCLLLTSPIPEIHRPFETLDTEGHR